jgi:ABC-type nitrate/sulfonate/bicarbonate transport system substrate-binding protein
MAARTMLVKHGLTPDKDVRFIEASFGAMGAMIRGHKIDLGPFPAPFWAAAEHKGDIRSLFTQADALGTQQFLLYAAKKDFVKSHRAVLVDFYEDYLRGLHAAVDPKNRDRVLKLIVQEAKAPVERFKDWALLKGKDYYHSADGKINIEALQNNINALKTLGLLKQTLDVKPHIDNSVVEEAAKRL